MVLNSQRELVLVSLVSGVVSITGYVLLKKVLGRYLCTHKTKQEQSKIYEEKELLDQYMLFNYADGKDFFSFSDLGEFTDVRNCFLFPKKVALLCREYCPDLFFSENPHPRSALDVGCAVGRSCFELTQLFDSVVGIDYSQSFVNFCNRMLREKRVDYEARLEGNVMQKLTARLNYEVDTSKVRFEVGDACHLRDDLGQFDLVLASNLICRLTEPMLFLNRLKTLVKPNGYVILSTPFSWGSQYTPQENWLGGFYDVNNKEVEGLDGLHKALDDSFVLMRQLNMPMFIRETRRKFQYTVCLITIWQRK